MAIFLLFLFGAAMGSFAGALIWRIKHKRNFVHERSECEKCHHALGVADLIPIFSWLALKGRCRYCNKKIAANHVIIELITALLFTASYLWWPGALDTTADILSFGFWLAYLTGIVVLVVYDMKWRLLPDVIVFPLIALALVELIIIHVWLQQGGLHAIITAGSGVLTIAGFFGILYLISGGRWIGLGDVKLGVFMGIVLGMPAALIALVGSYYVALFVVMPLLLSGKVGRKSHVAFGPFLLTSFTLTYFFGASLENWLRHIF